MGGVIKINNSTLMIATGVGVKNTIDLKNTVKYALDHVPMITIVEFGFYIVVAAIVLSVILHLIQKQPVDYKKTGMKLLGAVIIYALTYIPFIESFLSQDALLLLTAIEVVSAVLAVWLIGSLIVKKFILKKEVNVQKTIVNLVIIAIVYGLTYIPAIYQATMAVKLPILTYVCIGGVCVFNNVLMKTKLGQNMRTVGQSRTVANAAGINVDRTRIIAMILSTVLASWGQLIYLQNVGTFSTYGAHTQVGTFAIAALLVGGASVQKATNKQAILGVILFHTLFIVSPLAGKELFGDPMIGEYFRVFVSYGVIAMSLAMHAWETAKKRKAATAE